MVSQTDRGQSSIWVDDFEWVGRKRGMVGDTERRSEGGSVIHLSYVAVNEVISAYETTSSHPLSWLRSVKEYRPMKSYTELFTWVSFQVGVYLSDEDSFPPDGALSFVTAQCTDQHASTDRQTNSSMDVLCLQYNDPISIHPSIHPFIYPASQPVSHLYIQPAIYPSINLPVRLSIYSYVYLSICSSIHSSVHLSTCPTKISSIYPSVHLPICPSIYLCIHLSIQPSIIHPAIYLFVHPSIYPFVHLPIHLSIHLASHDQYQGF